MKRVNDISPNENTVKKHQAHPITPFKKLPKGIILFKNFLMLEQQRSLLLKSFELGSLSSKSHLSKQEEYGSSGGNNVGFYLCDNEKTRNMKMMNLGLKCEGGSHPIQIPIEWKRLVKEISQAARDQEPSLPLMDPNMCVVNLYCVNSKLSPHQDIPTRKDPSKPIVSISIGLSADFCLKKDYGKNHKEHKVSLF